MQTFGGFSVFRENFKRRLVRQTVSYIVYGGSTSWGMCSDPSMKKPVKNSHYSQSSETSHSILRYKEVNLGLENASLLISFTVLAGG